MTIMQAPAAPRSRVRVALTAFFLLGLGGAALGVGNTVLAKPLDPSPVDENRAAITQYLKTEYNAVPATPPLRLSDDFVRNGGQTDPISFVIQGDTLDCYVLATTVKGASLADPKTAELTCGSGSEPQP